MKKSLHALYAVIVAVCLLFAAFPVGAVSQTATFTHDGAVVDTCTAQDGKITLPSAPSGLNGVFAGWYAEIDGEKVLYPAKATVEIAKDVTFEALVISYAMKEGASVRVEDGDVALRFVSELAKEDYQTLLSILGEQNISFGTYIVASDYLVKTGNVFTLEALQEAGYSKYLDVKATGWYTQTLSTYTIAGSVSHILDQNYTRSYSGTGYLKLTYSDGSVGTVYTPYNPTDHSRNIYKVVLSFYNDRSPSYAYVIPAGAHGGVYVTHSPYTMQALDAMKAFLDAVADVRYHSENGKFVYETNKTTYYTSLWCVSYTGDAYERNVITITAPLGHSITEIKALLFGGARMAWTSASETVQVTESTIVIHHSAFYGPF